MRISPPSPTPLALLGVLELIPRTNEGRQIWTGSSLRALARRKEDLAAYLEEAWCDARTTPEQRAAFRTKVAQLGRALRSCQELTLRALPDNPVFLAWLLAPPKQQAQPLDSERFVSAYQPVQRTLADIRVNRLVHPPTLGVPWVQGKPPRRYDARLEPAN